MHFNIAGKSSILHSLSGEAEKSAFCGKIKKQFFVLAATLVVIWKSVKLSGGNWKCMIGCEHSTAKQSFLLTTSRSPMIDLKFNKSPGCFIHASRSDMHDAISIKLKCPIMTILSNEKLWYIMYGHQNWFLSFLLFLIIVVAVVAVAIAIDSHTREPQLHWKPNPMIYCDGQLHTFGVFQWTFCRPSSHATSTKMFSVVWRKAIWRFSWVRYGSMLCFSLSDTWLAGLFFGSHHIIMIHVLSSFCIYIDALSLSSFCVVHGFMFSGIAAAAAVNSPFLPIKRILSTFGLLLHLRFDI